MGVVADLISLEEVNAVARSMLSFLSDTPKCTVPPSSPPFD